MREREEDSTKSKWRGIITPVMISYHVRMMLCVTFHRPPLLSIHPLQITVKPAIIKDSKFVNQSGYEYKNDDQRSHASAPYQPYHYRAHVQPPGGPNTSLMADVQSDSDASGIGMARQWHGQGEVAQGTRAAKTGAGGGQITGGGGQIERRGRERKRTMGAIEYVIAKIPHFPCSSVRCVHVY